MFGKVKKWLGIEGVKLELDLPDYGFKQLKTISGKIIFYSKNAQRVTEVQLNMIEKYTRGRGKEKLIDEYQLGEIILKQQIDVPEEDAVSVDFTLPFQMVKSEMDEIQEKNFLTGGVVKFAKMLRKVKSEYYIIAEAKVEGTALNPFDKKRIELK